MNLAVIGSRSFDDYSLLKKELSKFDPELIISGGALGADLLGERYATENKIDKLVFYPKWDKYGKSAGYIRNRYIIEMCDEVLVFWNGKSKGTLSSINIAKEQNKKIHIVKF